MKYENLTMNHFSYSTDDCGNLGKTFERAIKIYLGLLDKVARQGNTDLRKSHICYEVKSGAGELSTTLNAPMLKGSTMVIYCPIVSKPESENQLVTDWVESQEAFVLDKALFLETLNACNLIREKTATNGTRKMTIQTFWNNKLNKPHGKGYDRLLNALYEEVDNGNTITFADWLESVK